jgi:hypothetical protein
LLSFNVSGVRCQELGLRPIGAGPTPRREVGMRNAERKRNRNFGVRKNEKHGAKGIERCECRK